MSQKIAVITGANRGIGYGIAKALGERGLHVVLTGRDQQKVKEAASELHRLGHKVTSIILDLSSKTSIDNFLDSFKDRYNSLDLLIHNAAILPDVDRKGPLSQVPFDVVEEVMNINFMGPLYFTQKILPHMSDNGRVIMVSARPALFEHLAAGTHMPAYKISKAALNAMTMLFAKEFPNLVVAAMHPGWVRSDMGGPEAHRSIEEGVDTVTWLALEAPAEVSGKMWMDRQQLEW